MIKWLKNLFGGSKSKPEKEMSQLDISKNTLLSEQGHYWELFENSVPVGIFKNPSRVAKEYSDLNRSKLYYHVNKYGTYKDDKYELVCQKS